MASLLSPQDLLQIQNVLEDTMDTFFTLPVTYRKATTLPDVWGEKKAETFTDYALFAFPKMSNNQTDTVQRTETGAFDKNDGYFLFSYLKLDEAGLIENGLPTMNPTTDFIIANGKTYQMEAVENVGFFVERPELVKVVVKKYPNAV
jgi:hypothetical protein